MRCIFCKVSSERSASVEHILPESLGNTEHVLPRGIVCDQCNNYFGQKIERPLLESIHFLNLRARQRIKSKRGSVPAQRGLLACLGVEVDLFSDKREGASIGAHRARDERSFINYLMSTDQGTIYIPTTAPIEPRLLARFVAKVGLEVLAQKTMHVPGWESEIIDGAQFNLARDFARRGGGPQHWPVHRRRLYPEDCISEDDDGDWYQVLHEYDLLYTNECELYAVLCIFGEEFVINLGQPKIDGYKKWLRCHGDVSPLYLA